ncbi:MAG: hypothetical protein GYA33_16760, partial [Thermogutta sp.]|nr:hypothetical protein [Thermogutta sp.]
KPQNLLLFHGRVKVGDLGLAKLVGASTASHTGFLGTIGYLPPEAWQEHRLTPVTDLYSLAATYVKLRTGNEPFGDNPGEIIDRQRRGDPILDGLEAGERPLLLAALDPDPARRPSEGAQNWVEQLELQLSGGGQSKAQGPAPPKAPPGTTDSGIPTGILPPIITAPPGRTDWPSWRDSRHHRTVALAVGIALIALIAVTIVVVAVSDVGRRTPYETASQWGGSGHGRSDVAGTIPPGTFVAIQPPGRCGFSPDGRRIVTASEDKTAGVWDAQTGERLLVLKGNWLRWGHTDAVLSAAYSPDGRRIVTASRDGTVIVWDAQTGERLRVLRGHGDWVRSAAFSPDGGRIVTASDDKTAGVWDAETGQRRRLLRGHTDSIWSAAFSPDGRRIVTASSDNTAIIWDAETGERLRVLKGHTDSIWSAGFSPDGRQIVTASWDNTSIVWDAQTGESLLVFQGHTDAVLSAVFSPDGGRIVTASSDGTAGVWDAETGQRLMALEGPTRPVASAAYSPDGGRIVTASRDKTAIVWDAENGKMLLTLPLQNERAGEETPQASVQQESTDADGCAWGTIFLIGGIIGVLFVIIASC